MNDAGQQRPSRSRWKSLDGLEITIRTYNALERAGIRTLQLLIENTERDLRQIRGLGEKALAEIRENLTTAGLSLRGEAVAYTDSLSVILLDELRRPAPGRQRAPRGVNYINAVTALLHEAGFSADELLLTPTNKILPADKQWDCGTPAIVIINDLLKEIGYREFRVVDGVGVAEPVGER